MYHLHVRYVTKGTGASTERTFDYIARTGRYRKRGDTVREVCSLNMPRWAAGQNAYLYWRTADSTASRSNARSAYMIEVALPAHLCASEQRQLVTRFVEQMCRLSIDGLAPHATLPITWAIHEGHGRNPHVHMLVSSSIHDGIERAPVQWFMRYNPKHPERGGAKRSRGMTRKPWLLQVRKLWGDLANQALKSAGLPPVMDHRAYRSRGWPLEPAVHLGPSAAHLLRQQRPAPRVQRYQTARERNEAMLQLNGQVNATRQRMASLQAQEALGEQMRRDWEARESTWWNEILANHPLAGDGAALLAQATAMVLESARRPDDRLYRAAKSPEFHQQVQAALSPDWQSVKTTAGLWLLRPEVDTVVLVGPGYLATDAEDEEALQLMLRSATLLPYEAPVVASRHSLVDRMKRQLQSIGKDWALKLMGGKLGRRLFKAQG